MVIPSFIQNENSAATVFWQNLMIWHGVIQTELKKFQKNQWHSILPNSVQLCMQKSVIPFETACAF
jgi:hypothetical protein